MIFPNNLITIGTLIKFHGVKGEILIRIFPEWRFNIADPPYLFLNIDGGLVPYEVLKIRVRGDGDLLVYLDQIIGGTNITHLQGADVNIESSYIENSAYEDKSNFHLLKGYQVYDKNLGVIGVIKSVSDIKNNPLLELEYNDKELFIPFHDDFIISIDHKAHRLYIKAPEGLIDLYLQ